MNFEMTSTMELEAPVAVAPLIDYALTYEIERGKPMPSKNHAILQMEIGFELKTHYGKQYDILPEHELELIKRAVPDLCIYEKMSRDWLHDTLRSTKPPLLAIEILSPRQLLDDILEKIDTIYFPSNVPSVWVVLPQSQSIMLFKHNQKHKTFSSGIMKDEASGFEIDIDKIFA